MDPLFMPDFTCCSRNWDSANQEVFFPIFCYPVLVTVTCFLFLFELLLSYCCHVQRRAAQVEVACRLHAIYCKYSFTSSGPNAISEALVPLLFVFFSCTLKRLKKKKSFTNNFLEKTGIKFFNSHKIKPYTDVSFLEDFKIEVLVSPALTDSLIIK